MVLTVEQIKSAVPYITDERIGKYLYALNQMFAKYEIDTPLRVAHYLSQIGHESASFKYVEEIADGSRYEGWKSLGNTQNGDGKRFKGRGVIQITGRANYKAYSDYVGVDFIANPKLLAEVPYCIDSSGWYWKVRGLNAVADKDDVRLMTKKINGGQNGLADRMTRLTFAKHALGL